MESYNTLKVKCRKHSNIGKSTKTTQTLLDEFSLNEVSRSNISLQAFLNAERLAKQFGYNYIPIMTSFIIDTGAGIHLKCFAKGMKTYDINQISLMSANGPLAANKATRVKFRNINNQECIVLENSPNVLSVGQLISQGFAFYWIPADPVSGIEQSATLVTPAGEVIHLLIKIFVPYFEDRNSEIGDKSFKTSYFDNSDLVSEPDFEVDLSENFKEQSSAAMPAIGTRIKVKSKIELSDRQQLALESAVENLITNLLVTICYISILIGIAHYVEK